MAGTLLHGGKNKKLAVFNFCVILLKKRISRREYLNGLLWGVGLSLVEGKLGHLITVPPDHIQWGRVNS